MKSYQNLNSILVFFLLNSLTINLFAQKDSSFALPLVSVHYGGNIPSGDLKSRFGANFNTGVGFKHKFKRITDPNDKLIQKSLLSSSYIPPNIVKYIREKSRYKILFFKFINIQFFAYVCVGCVFYIISKSPAINRCKDTRVEQIIRQMFWKSSQREISCILNSNGF